MKNSRAKLAIKQLVINTDGSAVLICEESDANPSGVFKLSDGQLKRLVAHTNSFAPQMLSNLLSMPFPSHYECDVEFRKEGDTWESADGKEQGTYTKDHYAFRNETIALAPVAQQTLFAETAKYAIQASLAPANPFVNAPVAQAPVAQTEEVASEIESEKA